MNATDHDRRQIAANIRAHQRIARRYEQDHGEIYNVVEQDRLHAALARALGLLPASATPPVALDFGCGAGNLTAHLLALGCTVVAADVTPAFLSLVAHSHRDQPRVSTVQLNGRDLEGLPAAGFDLVAAYSVLHHIPDYLGVVRELAGRLRPGGVLYLDHEHNEQFWQPDEAYLAYRATVHPPRLPLWRKLWRPDLYRDKLRLLFDSRYQRESDLHVWPEDHVEWHLVEAVLQAEGLEIAVSEDYLQFERGADPAVWEDCRSRSTDQRVVMARRPLGGD